MNGSSAVIHRAARSNRGLTDGARSLLHRRLYAVLATQNDDGTPHLAPVMFRFDDEDELIAIETGATTRKARNVADRPRATVLVQAPEVAWVLGTGPATIVGGEDATVHRTRIRDKYLTGPGHVACGGLLDEMDDVAIVVEPTYWLSWDLSAFMDDLASRGIDPAEADSWFLTDD